MGVTRCASSHVMTALLVWRNPQGRESNWLNQAESIENRWKHRGKVFATQIGLGVLIVTSSIETVAYSALTLVSRVLCPVTDRPYTFFAKLLQSSSFTIIWGMADGILFNPLCLNVMTHESFARFWAATLHPNPFVLVRSEDSSYINNQSPPNTVQAGANFITNDVLAGASPNTIDLFTNMCPSIFMFILTKATSIYTTGAKKNDTPPDFFTKETKEEILQLRQKLQNKEDVQLELARLTTDPDTFDTPPKDVAKEAFQTLRTIASKELQGGLFITKCWQKATEQLTSPAVPVKKSS